MVELDKPTTSMLDHIILLRSISEYIRCDNTYGVTKLVTTNILVNVILAVAWVNLT